MSRERDIQVGDEVSAISFQDTFIVQNIVEGDDGNDWYCGIGTNGNYIRAQREILTKTGRRFVWKRVEE